MSYELWGREREGTLGGSKKGGWGKFVDSPSPSLFIHRCRPKPPNQSTVGSAPPKKHGGTGHLSGPEAEGP